VSWGRKRVSEMEPGAEASWGRKRTLGLTRDRSTIRLVLSHWHLGSLCNSIFNRGPKQVSILKYMASVYKTHFKYGSALQKFIK
jgi:hypothetical protein